MSDESIAEEANVESTPEDTVTFEELTTQLENLRDQNKYKIHQLRSMGADVNVDSVYYARLELFLDMFLQGETRLVYEYKFESMMEEQLSKMLSEASREQLLKPMQGGLPHPLKMPR